MGHFRAIVTAFVLLALAGCANLNSIHRSGSFGPADKARKGYVALDAKQRVLLYGPSPIAKAGAASMAICAEQAPDVFSVISSSLAAHAGYGANATGTNADAKLAVAMSESGASIKRSQTINLLALSLFNTCLRYLDGAIPQEQFIIQSSRDHQLMIAVLSIEQLTSMARPESTVILGSGRSNAAGGSSAVDALVAAKSAADKAASKSTDDTTAYTTALADATDTPKTCDTIADTDKKGLCTKAKGTADLSAAAAKRAEDYYQAILKNSGGSASASAGENGAQSSVSVATPVMMDKEAIIAITEAVKTIALKVIQNDQDSSFCHELLLDYRAHADGNTAVEDSLARAAGCSGKAPPTDVPPANNDAGVRAMAGKARSQLGNPSIYVQISAEGQRPNARQIIANLRKALGDGPSIYGVDLKPAQSPDTSEVRYFREEDLPSAQFVADALQPAIPDVCVRLLPYASVTRDLVELWIGKTTPATDPTKVGVAGGKAPQCGG